MCYKQIVVSSNCSTRWTTIALALLIRMQNWFFNQNLCQDDNQFYKGRGTHTRASALSSCCLSLHSLLLFSAMSKGIMRLVCRTSHIFLAGRALAIIATSWCSKQPVGVEKKRSQLIHLPKASFGHSPSCSLACVPSFPVVW